MVSASPAVMSETTVKPFEKSLFFMIGLMRDVVSKSGEACGPSRAESRGGKSDLRTKRVTVLMFKR